MSIRYLSGINVDSNTLFVDSANDRVGIGTGSPAYPLDIVGFANSSSGFRVTDGTIDNRVSWSSGNVGFFGTVSNHPIAFNTNLTERMRITSAGNVGIGTTAPGSPLDVLGKVSINSDGTLNWGNAKDFGRLTWDTGKAIVRGESGKALSLGANGTQDYLYINTSGNVGIGTTSPGYKLDVNGVGNFSNGFSGPSSETGYRLKFYDNGGIHNDAGIGLDGSAVGGEVMWFNALGGFYFGLGTGGTKVTISNTGNVGIGTTAPGAKLDIVSTGTGSEGLRVDGASGGFAFVVKGGSDYTSHIRAGATIGVNYFTTPPSNGLIVEGNVGIGTTSPISYSGYTTLGIDNASSGGVVDFMRSGTSTFRIGADSTGNFLYGATSLPMVFSTNTNERMRITAAGNVGIGTTSPVVKLQVDGTITSTGVLTAYTSVPSINIGHNGDSAFIAATSGGGADTPISFSVGNNNEKMRITAAGNVGIGTTAPQAPLHVIAASNTNDALIQEWSYTSGTIDVYSLMLKQTVTSGVVRYNFSMVNASTAYNDVLVLDRGNVGIGTTSPSYLLDVNGSGRIGSGIGTGVYVGNTSHAVWTRTGGTNGNMALYSGGSDRITIVGDTGNVGIGTTSPVSKLHIDNALGSDVISISDAAGSVRLALGQESSYTGNYIDSKNIDFKIKSYLAGGSGGNIFFQTGTGTATTKVTINVDGNVGIGTTAPSSLLNIVASGSAPSALTVQDNARKVKIGRDQIEVTDLSDTAVTMYLQPNANLVINSSAGNVGIGVQPTQKLHVSGNIRVTGAYYDSNNSAGSSGQVLSSTGSGTAWVNQGEATATSLYDLLPAARTTYDWTVQLTAGTWADIFSSNTVLSNGTWMVQAFVSDFAVGGQQYSETYSGVMSWGSASGTNNNGVDAESEIILHRSGHAAQAGNFYLRTVERAASTLLFQGMSNQTYSAASTINFKFVKIF